MGELVKFTLPSFLRICHMGTGERIASIDKKLSSGSGYDYYHSLNRAIKEKVNGASTDLIDDILNSPANAKEREYNIAAYSVFEKRYASKKSIVALQKKSSKKYEALGIEITCDPVFMTAESGVMYCHSVWASRSVDLQSRYAAVGCYILRDVYRKSGLANSIFCIANLVDGRRFGEKSITNATSEILMEDLKMISGRIFSRI